MPTPANDNARVSTSFLLMAQFGGKAIVPISDVAAHYFSHLTVPQLLRKVSTGAIDLPVVRLEASQKCHKGVHLQDLADYLDARRAAAIAERAALAS